MMVEKLVLRGGRNGGGIAGVERGGGMVVE